MKMNLRNFAPVLLALAFACTAFPSGAATVSHHPAASPIGTDPEPRCSPIGTDPEPRFRATAALAH